MRTVAATGLGRALGPFARAATAVLISVAFETTAVAAPIAPAPLGSLDQQASAKPGPLEGVNIEQHLGTSLPLDAVFRDDEGKAVRIGDYFGAGKKPAVLAMAYFECPMLCTLVLNGMVKALRPLSFTAGNEFDVIVVSIDPKETPELAAKKKAAYLDSYSRKGVQRLPLPDRRREIDPRGRRRGRLQVPLHPGDRRIRARGVHLRADLARAALALLLRRRVLQP